MTNKYVSCLAVVLLFCGNTALSNPLKDAEKEMSEVVGKAENLESVVNSKTMKAARAMCLMTADRAFRNNPDAEKSFTEVAAHCAMGNLHHALGLLGNDDSIYEKYESAKVPSGASRDFTKWEHDIIKAWDKVK